jgi:alkylation response protein AidB-like acyl-CoA dehydrogenase
MDLELTEDQELLRKTAVRFIENELPISRIRELVDDPAGYSQHWLRRGAELGWFAMLVPEDHGGGSVSGSGLLDLAIVAEELGRRIQPGPFLPMNVVAFALASSGSEEQQATVLPAIASGEGIATWALADPAGYWDNRGLTAMPTRNGFCLSGTKGYVQDAKAADWILVSASVEGQSTQFLVPAETSGMRITPLECFDLARRMAELRFEDVEVPDSALVGEVGAADEDVERQLQVALVLQCAETVGVIGAVLDMTVQYAKDRIAFGRPIGSFQAPKHILADLALYAETCKAGAVAAADAVDRDLAQAGEVASMAKAYIGDMAVEIAQESLQVHGGIGYTWEHDLHLFMRRASVNSVMYGGPAWHRERICAMHGLGANPGERGDG